jgi:hypothetical protein
MMIKKIYLTLFICLFIWSCDSPKNDSPQLQENEKLLRSITTTKFNVVEQFGEPSTFFNYQEVQIFDTNGNLTEIAYYDSLGNPSTAYSGKVHKEKYIYNEDNKEVRNSRFDIKGDYVSEYSDWVTIVTKYDSLGNESERIGYNKWEDINFIVKYRTDINGVEESIQYDKDNNVESETYTSYDSNRNIIQMITYGARGKRANKVVNNYVYNSDNKQTQMTTECNYDCYEYGWYGKEQNFLYDDKGNLIEQTFIYPEDVKFENSRFKAKKVYRYDEKNRLIEELNFDKNNEPLKGRSTISKTTYEYFDDNSYELIHYFLTEKFGEPEYGVYWKELVQEEFY